MLKAIVTSACLLGGGIGFAAIASIQANPRTFTSAKGNVTAASPPAATAPGRRVISLGETWVIGDLAPAPVADEVSAAPPKPAVSVRQHQDRRAAKVAPSSAPAKAPPAARVLVPCSSWSGIGPRSVTAGVELEERRVRQLCTLDQSEEAPENDESS